MAERVAIKTAYITLAQLLKMENLIASGGQAKALAEQEVELNGEAENRRGKKLYPGDQVVIHQEIYQIEGMSAEDLAEEAEKQAILERFANRQQAAKKQAKKPNQSKPKVKSKKPTGPGSWN